MLQPMIIFAYLGMLVVAFDTVVYSGPTSLYRAIAGSSVGPVNPPSINPNFQIGIMAPMRGRIPVRQGRSYNRVTGTIRESIAKMISAARTYKSILSVSWKFLVQPNPVNDAGELGTVGQLLKRCTGNQVCTNTAGNNNVLGCSLLMLR